MPHAWNTRGSALMVAVIFTAILGAIIIPTYLYLSFGTLRLSDRAFHNTSAVNLAESGIEHAMWALLQHADGEDPWDGWTIIDGQDARREFSGFSYHGGAIGSVHVAIIQYRSETPEVVSRAIIEFPNGDTLDKWMHATLKSGRSLFAYGMLAREHINSSGGAWFDSWISDPDKDPATPPVPYSSSVALDRSKIASASTDIPSISLGSSDLYGTVAVGADSEFGLAVSWGGQVGPRGMNEHGARVVAPGAITTGFTATFEEVIAPPSSNYVAPYVLPYSLNRAPWYVSAESIGTPGHSTTMKLNNFRVEGAATLTIRGDVILILPTGGKNFVVTASGKVKLDPGASLTVYTEGDVEVSGAGVVNPNAPQSFQIWGTSTTSQREYSIAGSGEFHGVIYAPQANVKITGHADVFGAVVANSVLMTGSGSFHYDESLADLTEFSKASAPSIDFVKELNTPASRAPYLGLVSLD